MAQWEHLPLHLQEELKTKKIFPFVIPEDSSCNRIRCQVHIFPAVDRNPITNDDGSYWISSLDEIEVLPGYRWENDWSIVIQDALTDKDGYQYASSWRNLQRNSCTTSESFSTFFRRKIMIRDLVIDYEAVSKMLPYELVTRIEMMPLTSRAITEDDAVVVEFLVDDDVKGTGLMGSPLMYKSFALPLAYIQRQKKVTYRLSKTDNKRTTPLAKKTFLIGEIADLIAQSKLSSALLFKDKTLTANVTWRLLENNLFYVDYLSKSFNEGQLSNMVLSESRMSQRLKEKIIMISLLSGSTCGGLLRDITALLAEGHSDVEDYHLIEILEDLNSMQGRKEFGKLINLMRDVELADREANPIHYPYSIPLFEKFTPMPQFEINEQNIDLVQRYRDNLSTAQLWFTHQPCCLSQVMKQYQQCWLKDSNNHDGQNIFRIDLFLRDESLSFGLIWDNCYDYYSVLKYISILRYNRLSTSDSLNTQRILQHVTTTVLVDGRMFKNVILSIDLEEECLDLNLESASTEAFNLFPIRLLFELIDGIEVSHSHFVSLTNLLEIRLLSATSFVQFNQQNKLSAMVEVESADGQYAQYDFEITHEMGLNHPGTGTIDSRAYIFIDSTVTNHRTPAQTFSPQVRISLLSLKPSNASTIPVNAPHHRTNTSGSHNSLGRAGSTRRTEEHLPLMDKRHSLHFSSPVTPVSNSVGTSGLRHGHYVKLGQVWMPPISCDPLCEQEMQLWFEKPDSFYFNIQLLQIHWVDERVLFAALDVYALLYLSDNAGNIISISSAGGSGSYDIGSPAPSSNVGGLFLRRNLVNQGRQSGYFHRSAMAFASNFYVWEAANITLDIKRYPIIQQASYILVELWTVDESSGRCVDKYLGEALISLVKAKEVQTDQAIVKTAITLGNSVVGEHFLAGGPMAKHYYHIGYLDCTVSVSVNEQLNAGHPAASSTTHSRSSNIQSGTHKAHPQGNCIKLTASQRPLQAFDCAWPCQILSHSEKGLESDLYQITLGSESLHFKTYGNADLSLFKHQERINVLEECAERESISPTCLHLAVPYSQIDPNDLCVLTPGTLFIGLQLQRKFTVNAASHEDCVVFKPVRIELIVGPCLAEDLHASIRNKLATLPMRNFLSSHLSSSETEQEESFLQLTKMLEDAIYETTVHIERAAKAEDTNVTAGSQLTTTQRSTSPSIPADQSDKLDGQNRSAEEKSHSFDGITQVCDSVEAKELTAVALRNPVNKLLHLKLATLRVYLWFLLERSSTKLASKDNHFVDPSWILFENNGGNTDLHNLFSYINDIDTLFFRVGELMRRLEREVRQHIFKHLHNSSSDCSESLTKMIHSRYTYIVTMLLEALDYSSDGNNLNKLDEDNDKKKAIDIPDVLIRDGSQSSQDEPRQYSNGAIRRNPQKRRDLIKYIITNDEIFESHLNALLRSHNYNFTRRPLLSLCISFEDLLNQFGTILDESLLMWNNRTLKHFMNHKDITISSLPWEITSMEDPSSNNMLYISNIPETIQMQLNVEIGLKRIIPHANVLDHSDESLQRIDAMNKKISIAIIRSYMSLAYEYEQILDLPIFHSLHGHDYHEISHEKDALLCFLASVVNDCSRIREIHIPQTIDLFNQDHHLTQRLYPDQHRTTRHDHRLSTNIRKSMSTKRESLYQENIIDDDKSPTTLPFTTLTNEMNMMGLSMTILNSGLSFDNCIKAVMTVSRKAANVLTNQIFFHSRLYDYFMDDLTNQLKQRMERFKHEYKISKQSSHTSESILSNIIDRYSSLTTKRSIDESPLAVIHATLSEFLLFIGQHLSIENAEAVFYLCMFKLVVRYLIFTRDYHHLRIEFIQTHSTSYWRSTTVSNNDMSEDAVQDEYKAVWKEDLRHILLLHAEVKEKLFMKTCKGNSMNSFSKDRLDQSWKTGQTTRLSLSPPVGNSMGHSSVNGVPPDNARLSAMSVGSLLQATDEAFTSTVSGKYGVALVGLLNKVSSCVMMTISGDWSSTSDDPISAFLLHNFNLMIPAYDADVKKYHAKLEQMLRFDSAFTHFVPPRQIIDGNHVKLCDLEIDNLACFNWKKKRSLFMKIYFNDQIFVTTLQEFSPLVQWKEKINITGVPISQVKSLMVEVYSFRIAIIKKFREQLVGAVCINLLDLARTDDPVAPALTSNLNATTDRYSLFVGSKEGRETIMKPTVPSLGPTTEATTRNSVASQDLNGGSSIMPSLTSPGPQSTTHTAWYIVQARRGLVSREEHRVYANAKLGRRARRAMAAGRPLQQEVTYVNTMATQSSQGPLLNINQPQIRISIRISFPGQQSLSPFSKSDGA